MHCLNDVYFQSLNVEISVPIYLFYFNGCSIIRTILSTLDDFMSVSIHTRLSKEF